MSKVETRVPMRVFDEAVYLRNNVSRADLEANMELFIDIGRLILRNALQYGEKEIAEEQYEGLAALALAYQFPHESETNLN